MKYYKISEAEIKQLELIKRNIYDILDEIKEGELKQYLQTRFISNVTSNLHGIITLNREEFK